MKQLINLKWPKEYMCMHIRALVYSSKLRNVASSRAVATGPVGPVSTGPLFGALSYVFVVNQRLMAARTSFKASLPNLPDTPHHLKDVAFPKRTLKSPLGRGDFIYALLVPALCVRARVANVLGETPLRNRSMR